MDFSISLETQSNLSKDHQEAVSAFTAKRRPNSLVADIMGQQRVGSGEQHSRAPARSGSAPILELKEHVLYLGPTPYVAVSGRFRSPRITRSGPNICRNLGASAIRAVI